MAMMGQHQEIGTKKGRLDKARSGIANVTSNAIMLTTREG